MGPTPFRLFQTITPFLEQLVALDIIASFRWDPDSKSQIARLDTLAVALRLEMPAKRNDDGTTHIVDLTGVTDETWETARGIGRLLTLHQLVEKCMIQRNCMHLTCCDPIETDSTICDSSNAKLVAEMQASQQAPQAQDAQPLMFAPIVSAEASRRTQDWVQNQEPSTAAQFRVAYTQGTRKSQQSRDQSQSRAGFVERNRELPVPTPFHRPEVPKLDCHENILHPGSNGQRQAQQVSGRAGDDQRSSQQVERQNDTDSSLEVSGGASFPT